ncbi:unnamed protein product [Camellia sinensis]
MVRGGWCSNRVSQSHGCSLWKGIWLGRKTFWDRVRFKVAIGDRVRFWEDRWCGELSLAAMFPLIFAIAADVEELVALVRVRQGQSYTWNLHLRRNVQDWELDQLVGLLGFLYELQFGGDGEDTLSWEGPRAKGIFLVSSFYGMLEGGGVGVFPWKNIWAVGSPSKVAFFV